MKIPALPAVVTLLLGLALTAPPAASESELRRPANWAALPKAEQPWVWVMDLGYRPEPQPQAPFQGLRITLLPIHDSNNLDSHLDVPPEKFRKEKVLTRLTDEQRHRVIAVQVMSRPSKGKVGSAILTSQPFADLLFDAISRELEALGAEVVPSPIESAPITTESFVRLVADLPREGSVDYYLAIKIEDLYCEQFYRCCRTDPLAKAAGELAQQLFGTAPQPVPMELIPWVSVSFDLSLRLADAKAGKLRWEGRSTLNQAAEGPSSIHLIEWWEGLVRSSFPALIQEAIRSNQDLRYALEPPAFRIRMPRREQPVSIAEAPAAESLETTSEEPEREASAIAPPRTIVVAKEPDELQESEPPPSR